MKILLIGPPASGKGTVGSDMSANLGVPFITVGQILRDMDLTDEDYKVAHEYMDRGDLVPANITARLVKERIALDDCKNGYIMDGWCRRMKDLETYDPGFDKVVLLDISKDTVMKRITGRRICEADGEIYNIYTLPKEELAKCPGKLVQREDDTVEVVNRRWDVHVNDTLPVIKYFEEQGILCRVDAEVLPEQVLECALSCVE